MQDARPGLSWLRRHSPPDPLSLRPFPWRLPGLTRFVSALRSVASSPSGHPPNRILIIDMKYPISLIAMAAGLLAIAPLKAAEFVVDPAQSAILVDVSATGHDFTARLENYSLKIAGDASSATPKTASLSWDFKDLKTGDAKRDHEMLKWMDHPKHAKGSFSLESVLKSKDGSTWARGKLTFHGVSKTIQFPVTKKKEGNKVTATGSTRIDHRDFGLKKIRKFGFLTVDPVVTVRFSLVGSIN